MKLSNFYCLNNFFGVFQSFQNVEEKSQKNKRENILQVFLQIPTWSTSLIAKTATTTKNVLKQFLSRKKSERGKIQGSGDKRCLLTFM